VQFGSLHSLQNALRDLDRVKIRVRVTVWISFRSEICKLRTSDFEITHGILQIAQCDKSSATDRFITILF